MSEPVTTPAADPQPSPQPDDAEVSWVAAEEGACPMCGEGFDDPADFRGHLSEVHDLVDDEGKETDFGHLAVPLPNAPSHGPAIPELAAPERPYVPPVRDRPIGLIVFVLLLLCVLGGMIAFFGPGGDDEVATDGEPARSRPASAPSPADAAPSEAATTPAAGPTDAHVTSSPASPSPTGPSSTGSSTGSSSAGSSPSSGTGSGTGSSKALGSTTTTTPPAPTTTEPPAAFTAPSATGAEVDSCERVPGGRLVTYSWSFTGGTGWEPDPAYTSLGGGRYRHSIAAPRRKDVAITTVVVRDANGNAHGVSLQPSLSTASC